MNVHIYIIYLLLLVNALGLVFFLNFFLPPALCPTFFLINTLLSFDHLG